MSPTDRNKELNEHTVGPMRRRCLHGLKAPPDLEGRGQERAAGDRWRGRGTEIVEVFSLYSLWELTEESHDPPFCPGHSLEKIPIASKYCPLFGIKGKTAKSATEPAGHASLSDHGLRWDTATMRARLYRRCSCREAQPDPDLDQVSPDPSEGHRGQNLGSLGAERGGSVCRLDAPSFPAPESAVGVTKHSGQMTPVFTPPSPSHRRSTTGQSHPSMAL